MIINELLEFTTGHFFVELDGEQAIVRTTKSVKKVRLSLTNLHLESEEPTSIP